MDAFHDAKLSVKIQRAVRYSFGFPLNLAQVPF